MSRLSDLQDELHIPNQLVKAEGKIATLETTIEIINAILGLNDCDIPACNCGTSHHDYRNRNTVYDLKAEMRRIK